VDGLRAQPYVAGVHLGGLRSSTGREAAWVAAARARRAKNFMLAFGVVGRGRAYGGLLLLVVLVILWW